MRLNPPTPEQAERLAELRERAEEIATRAVDEGRPIDPIPGDPPHWIREDRELGRILAEIRAIEDARIAEAVR